LNGIESPLQILELPIEILDGRRSGIFEDCKGTSTSAANAVERPAAQTNPAKTSIRIIPEH
jgi:hypothetical protein